LFAKSKGQMSLLLELRKGAAFFAGASASCKTVFVMSLLKELVGRGHRTLVFSQSRVMLNILEAGLRDMGLAFLRIDGTINSAAERQVSIADFRKHVPAALETHL
jgi:DNA excision repair protein ERCC-6-like